MKNLIKRLLGMALILTIVVGMMGSALAYQTPDFSDVPSGHWAYEAVMKMADAGVIKGTGNGQFSPDMKLSAEMFVVLVGRVVFPDVKAEEADWSGPYVAEAKAKGLLEGTNVTDANIKGDISRYDMAVILAKCVEILKVNAAKADSSKVTDYGEVPAKYIDAVLMAYGSGLIRGDQSGSFNGQNSMTRQEAATVMDRLLKLKASGSQGGTVDSGSVTTPENPTEAAYVLEVRDNTEIAGTLVPGEKTQIVCGVIPVSAAPYGSDRSGIVCASSNPAVAEVTRADERSWYLTAVSEGTTTITMTDPYGVAGSKEFKVVATRDDMETKTFTLNVRTAVQETHTLRGDAYTEYTFFYSIPYKIYYTRDGGKTSQLVYEGITPSKDGSFDDTVKVELPEDVSYSKDASFYISAETVQDGQRLVTSDLRTDGRAYATLVPIGYTKDQYTLQPSLVLPAGEKAKFTIKGAVTYGLHGASRVGEGFTVQLHLKDGRIVGEATTDASGSYTLNCEVDAIDNGFNTKIAQYYVTASGVHDGVRMETNGIRSNGELLLWSSEFMGANPHSDIYRNVSWYFDVFPVD